MPTKLAQRLAKNLRYAKARTRALAGSGVAFNPSAVSGHTRNAAATSMKRAGRSSMASNILAGAPVRGTGKGWRKS